jgi:hypothetical protein
MPGDIRQFFGGKPAAAKRAASDPEGPAGAASKQPRLDAEPKATAQVDEGADKKASPAAGFCALEGAGEGAGAVSNAHSQLVGCMTDESWSDAMGKEFKKPYFLKIATSLDKEAAKNTVFPPLDEVFAAFNRTPVDKVKVVIIGQDPYHDNNQVKRFFFSVFLARLTIVLPPQIQTF